MSILKDDINRIANGDEGSFCRFMEFHSERLYYFTRGLVRQREAAEEIVSDVFFEVWKARKDLGKIENINSWLYTITYRKSISFLRKKKGNMTVSLDEIQDFVFEPLQSPDEKLISKEEITHINNAIQQLPPKCKQVFFLTKIEGMPYLEISKILGISVKTINNHVAKAILIISSYLKKNDCEFNQKKHFRIGDIHEGCVHTV